MPVVDAASHARSSSLHRPARLVTFLQDLFALKAADLPILLRVAPVFAVVTAISVVSATFTKAVYLDVQEAKNLPWMFLSSSLFTAIASIGYVSVIENIPLIKRFLGLLGIGLLTFTGLQFAYPLAPKGVALVQLVWCTAICNLVLVQTWNAISALLPARQGKRLFPVLAAVSTLGAALGGVSVSLAMKVAEARQLMWLVLLLMAWLAARISPIIHELESMDSSAEDLSGPSPVARRSAAVVKVGGDSEIARGFKSIFNTPLLLRLAGLVFLLQVASLILDFQFSSELKIRYRREEIAGFLGTYYGIANTVAFFVALMATSRIVRIVGIGMSISASAVLIAGGMAIYWMAGSAGYDWAFWAVVAASFFERIGQFALSRNAMQMLVMPLESRKGERAKTLIDGVIYRVATALVSVVLLILASRHYPPYLYAIPAIFACIGAVGIGLSMGPHYRRALFEGLRARRMDADSDPQTRALMMKSALGEVRQRLAKTEVKEVVQALDMIRDMQLPVQIEDLLPVARSQEPELARRALELMNDLGLRPDAGLLLSLLQRDRAPGVLREGLRMLAHFPNPDLVPLISTYVTHDDPGVARMAVVWLHQVGGHMQHQVIERQLREDLTSTLPERRARAAYISSGYAAAESMDLARMLDDPSLQVRQNAVESMGQIGSPEYLPVLIQALSRPDLVQSATAALQRYGTKVLTPIRQRFEEGLVGTAVLLRLLRIAEKVASADAVQLLMDVVDRSKGVLRSNAIVSLWRLAREADRPKPPRVWVHDHVKREIDLLLRYQFIEQRALGDSSRHVFFLGELQALREQSEARCFRLLGLLTARAAMHKAYLYYRSPAQRTRSTAIELLDQHLIDPELKPFVAIIERASDLGNATTNRTFDSQVPGGYTADGAQLQRELERVEPWLARVWGWTIQQAPAQGWAGKAGQGVARDPMDLVFLLKGVSLFRDLSGEQLLPLTDIAQNVHVDAGDLVFAEGEPGDHLYVILDGEVEVLHAGERVAKLGQNECFGEMALLDSQKRSASIRAMVNVELLAIARDDFQDLLDLHPVMARGVIRVLTQRLRNATEAVAEEKH